MSTVVEEKLTEQEKMSIRINAGLREVISEQILPPPNIDLDEWADRYRILETASSSQSGLWRTSTFPYMREIMKELSPSRPAEFVALMKGSQAGGSELGINLMGYCIHLSPQPILYVQKTVDSVKRFSHRVSKSFAKSPEIVKRMAKSTSRNKSNTIFQKDFRGGQINFGGANSSASLRSMPISCLIMDEIDSFERDVDGEGDPVQLLRRRTANFPNRIQFAVSSPTLKGTSRIEDLFLRGDQRYYYVPCPHCTYQQKIEWANIKYENRKILGLKCISCLEIIKETYKTQMFKNGDWIAENPEKGEFPSFHLSALYSPFNFFKWEAALELWLEYKDTNDITKLITFKNTILGETFEDRTGEIPVGILSERCEDYKGDMPEDCLILTAGVDVQDDRLEVEIVGWGVGLESWSIDYAVLKGSVFNDEVWKKLDDYLLKKWKHPSGKPLNPYVTFIDSGSGTHADQVFKFCGQKDDRYSRQVTRKVFASKGFPRLANQDLVSIQQSKNRGNCEVINVSTGPLKTIIMNYIKVQEGQGRCHFPKKIQYDIEHFERFLSEKPVRKRIDGVWKTMWQIIRGKRNEQLDCRVYAMAAIKLLAPDLVELKAKYSVSVVHREKLLY